VVIIVSSKGGAVSQQQLPQQNTDHDDVLSLEGMDHLFKWAAEMVADGDDLRLRVAREKRVKRDVLEIVHRYHEQKAVSKSKDEIAYLQRRTIALMQRVQDLTEENAAVKQVMVSQYFALEQLQYLEIEVKRLKVLEIEKEAAVEERRFLMDALSKLKVERDFLEDTLDVCEKENSRLAGKINDLNYELIELREFKNRKWYQHLYSWYKSLVCLIKGRQTT
jgi:cell division protein FtsB